MLAGLRLAERMRRLNARRVLNLPSLPNLDAIYDSLEALWNRRCP